VGLPWRPALLFKPRVAREHPQGHFVEGRTRMHVSPGVGTLYLPIRFLCRPEVNVLILRRTAAVPHDGR